MKDDILQAAIDHFGCELQQVVAMEEMSELTKELCKYRRGAKNEDRIAEEIADVQIMLWQLRLMFGNDQDVDGYISAKLARLQSRTKDFTQ